MLQCGVKESGVLDEIHSRVEGGDGDGTGGIKI